MYFGLSYNFGVKIMKNFLNFEDTKCQEFFNKLNTFSAITGLKFTKDAIYCKTSSGDKEAYQHIVFIDRKNNIIYINYDKDAQSVFTERYTYNDVHDNIVDIFTINNCHNKVLNDIGVFVTDSIKSFGKMLYRTTTDAVITEESFTYKLIQKMIQEFKEFLKIFNIETTSLDDVYTKGYPAIDKVYATIEYDSLAAEVYKDEATEIIIDFIGESIYA